MAGLFGATTLVLAVALAATWVYTYQLLTANVKRPPSVSQLTAPISPLQVRYQLDVPGRGEIYPALVSGNPTDYWPVAILTIANLSDQHLLETVTAEIPEVSQTTTQTVILAPRETRAVRINPNLMPGAFENIEMREANLEVRASTPGNQSTFEETHSVYLHPVADIYWGKKFANSQFIARWVTPHDPAVVQLVSSARKYVPRGRLAGYHLPAGDSTSRVAAQVQSEARAVFDAMANLGISYVDSISTLGNFTSASERVRLPWETLHLESANCIDISVAYASAMENLGMHPVIVIVPGHAFVGVRLAPGSPEILYVDLTVLPDGTFEQAVARAQQWMKKTPSARVLMVDIAAARALGIYPIPEAPSQQS
ncbi:MAG TPA: hypothetical protein VKV95_06485 [Terriglobia bacterium]|nr:hypothetical protein [Terriglobia bacterium]